MSTEIQPCEIVIPGYVLTERIGSGGYAEVWRADAPGGLQKAVKIVYGYYDDEFASQELKALERVKGVRHPFLLSLERFEIISGRLAILTELADMSLDQRLRECRAEGHTGIPRDELLRYMADAAEALDFLSQKHNLLHLDIKPENLLVLGDHIKVADFGLVKELASRTQNSLVSGMTPTYASPEMFDDDPTAHSDQYSLAIVYQEMLVGTLPFPGRTAAQLAKQHTQAEPQLMSLPPTDRNVVGRALAKNPEERFPSCRAFIEALVRGEVRVEQQPSPIPRPTPVVPQQPSTPSPDDTKPSLNRTTIRRSMELPIEPRDAQSTQPVNRVADGEQPRSPNPTISRSAVHGGGANGALAAAMAAGAKAAASGFDTGDSAAVAFVPGETIDVAVPEIAVSPAAEQPTFYIALGGTGIQTLSRLRALLAERARAGQDTTAEADHRAWFALDTDRNELREAASAKWKSPLNHDDTLHLPLRLPKSYDDAREILGWVSRRWLYNIPRSLETRGFRALGRVALVDHAQKVVSQLNERLEKLASKIAADGEKRIRVVLLAGMGGGTGAGAAIDVANAVRALAEERGLTVDVQGFLLCTCFSHTNASPLVAANTYSFLLELNHVSQRGNVGANASAKAAGKYESPRAPFDRVYCIPVRARATDGPGQDVLATVAKYLTLEESPEVRVAVQACRAEQGTAAEQPPLVLSKFGQASIEDRKRELVSELASELALAVKRHWLAEDRGADWPRLVREEQLAASVPKVEPAAGGDPNATPTVLPYNDASPLALRGRFKEAMAMVFTSEVLAQVEGQLAAKDDRGRPLLVGREAKQIADAARDVAHALILGMNALPADGGARFANSPTLQPLINEASERLLHAAVEKFNPREPERFLPIEALDENLRTACLELLTERRGDPKFGPALLQLMQFDDALARTIEQAGTDLLQCACERRTLVLVPCGQEQSESIEKLRSLSPLAKVVPAEVDDVVVITEDTGVSPQSFARGLEHVFPGIAEAAHRLLTRTDVDWKDVR
jgi:serine/threonine protein kinase